MFEHRPVMPREVVYYLGVGRGGTYVDCTAGGGGHALEILKADPQLRLIGLDRDGDAIEAASRALEAYKKRVVLVKGNFKDIKEILRTLGIESADGLLFDLGVSSYQFDMPERGFSFRYDARLDMRMDRSQELSARDIVNKFRKKDLEWIFREYGEERFAGKIASAVEKARKVKPVTTTGELTNIILEAVPRRFHAKGIHPATRVFQALRIAVNDELENLKEGISDGVTVLKKGGRIVVISFHSLEDRIVKEKFRDLAAGCVCPPRVPMCVCGRKEVLRLLTKRPVTPREDEIDVNPRARSAKLRAAERI